MSLSTGLDIMVSMGVFFILTEQAMVLCHADGIF